MSSAIRPISYPPPRIGAQTRRDFLAWLGAGPALSVAHGADDDLLADARAALAAERLFKSNGGLRPTSKDALGPYFEPGAPDRPLEIAGPDEPGVRLGISGEVFGPDGRTPLAGYTLDVWQADKDGSYYNGPNTGYRLRGKVKTDAEGRYRFESVLPGRYGDEDGIRPAHVHVRFMSPGENLLLTTQLYFEGDPYLGRQDNCTRKGSCDATDQDRHLHLREGVVGGRSGMLSTFNARLPRR